ncbi:MAG: DUF6438 domain-containing protein [Bacteroidota bacterium]
MNTMRFFTILCLALSLSGCNLLSKFGINLTETNLNELTKLVEMSKGPCYGRCPVYDFTIYDNGIMTYEGKRFTEREGLYIKKMSESDLKELKSLLQAANLRQFRDAYRARVPDLQSVSITYHMDDYMKTIIGKDGRPEKVMEVQGELEKYAESSDWQLYAKQGDDLPEYIVEDELRIVLNDNVDINAWVRKYRRQGMEVVRNMSRSNNLWLVSFNGTKNDPKEVLAIVQADLEVANAEFNRKATN